MVLLKTAIFCLSLNIYFEARGEPLLGQYAVAHVTMNRVKENNSSICQEVFKKNQFSWTKKKYRIPHYENMQWKLAKVIAKQVINEEIKDNTYGSTFFINVKSKNRNHLKDKKRTIRLQNHIFFKRI